jgi:hypothetical protein
MSKERTLYVCVGCAQVHYDSDYNPAQGDLKVLSLEKLEKSIEVVKREYGL